MIDNSTLGFLVSDREKNLVLYMYQPEARESFGGKFSNKFVYVCTLILFFVGQRLLRKADFHLGQAINTFFKIKCKVGELGDDKKHFTGTDKRFITMFGKSQLKFLFNIDFYIGLTLLFR